METGEHQPQNCGLNRLTGSPGVHEPSVSRKQLVPGSCKGVERLRPLLREHKALRDLVKLRLVLGFVNRACLGRGLNADRPLLAPLH